MSGKVTKEAGKLIKNYIEEHGMKKKHFCKKCNISLVTLNKILSGNRNSFDWTMSKIASFIGVDYEDLYKRKYRPPKKKFGVVNLFLVEKFMKENKLYLYDLCQLCKVGMWDMRNILYDFHRTIDNNIFYKLAKTIGVKVERLFVGISQEAKSLLKKYQNLLPCNLD